MPSVISLTLAPAERRSWKAHLVADDLAERRLQLLGDALGDAGRGDAARLCVTDEAAAVGSAPAELQGDLRQLRRLARARLAGDDDGLVRTQCVGDVVAPRRDGQRLGKFDRRKHAVIIRAGAAPSLRSGIHRYGAACPDARFFGFAWTATCTGAESSLPHRSMEIPMLRLTRLAVALALTSSASLAIAADPIKIGVDGPFTGGSSTMGVSMRDGVRLAVDEINKAGGVLGRPLTVVERDDEAKNERGVQIAQELVNKEKVVAVVGYINTGVALASERFFQDAKIPVMNNVAHRLDPHAPVRRPARELRLPQRRARLHPGADDRRGGDHAPRLQEGRDPGRLDQLRPARPGRSGEGADGQGHHAGRRREVQHQGRRHDGPVAEGQGSRRRSRPHLRHRPRASRRSPTA